MPTYLVETIFRPGVTYKVDQAEYERLRDGDWLVGDPDRVTPEVLDQQLAAAVADTDSLTRAAVQSIVSVGGVADATGSSKGVIQLAGDLGGSATAPTVPGLASKVNSSTYTAGLATKQDAATLGEDVAADPDARAAFETKRTINVTDHGAVGDWNGTTGTDNLAAFDAAATQALQSGQPHRIGIPAGRYWLSDTWLLDGEDIEVVADPSAEIITTDATSLGMTVGLLGHGLLSPNNVGTPQRGRCSWHGGKVTATGSGTMDNALGVSRYRACHVSDVILDADRKGLTAQYGVDNIVWERIRVTRAGLDAITVETDCKSVRIRDTRVVSVTGVGVLVTSADTGLRNSDVTLDGVVIDSAGGHGFSVGLTDGYALRRCHVVSTGGQGLYVADTTRLSIDGATVLPSIQYGSNVAPKAPNARPLPLSGTWVAYGAPYGDPMMRVTADGFVVLEGAIKGGGSGSGQVLATLPDGFRPSVRRRLLVERDAGPAASIYIEPDGTIRWTSTVSATTFVSLDNVIFPIV